MRNILAVLVVMLAYAGFTQADPPCHMSELVSCINIGIEWVNTLNKRSLPETDADVEKMCSSVNEVVDCLLKFKASCLTPIQKEIVDLVTDGALELKEDFCTSGSDSRSKYLAHSPCLNKVSQSEEVKERIEYILAVLEKLPKVADSQKIMYSCCGYENILNAFIKQSTDTCGEEATNAAKDITAIAVGQLPFILCGGIEGEEESCKSLLPPKGTKPSEAIKGNSVYQFIHKVLKNWLD